MKLNLHIFAHEIAGMVKKSRLPENSELTILSVQIASADNVNCEKDIAYIVREGTPMYTLLNDGKYQLLVITDGNPNLVYEQTKGDCLILSNISEEQLLKEILAVFERYNRWELSVENAIVQGASLDHILEIGFSMIENPIALCDTSLHAIATYRWESVPAYNSLRNAISEPGYANIYLNALLQEANLLEKVRGEPHAFVYQLQEDDYQVLHMNVFSGKKRIAYLVTVDTFTPIDMHTCSIANRFGELLAFALSASAMLKQQQNPYNIDVLSQRLLAGELPDRTYVQYMLEQIGWKESDTFCVFEIEMLDNATSHNLLTDVSLFQAAIRDSLIFCYRAGIILIHNLTKSRQDYSTLILMLQELLRRRLYAGGGSDVFSGFSNLSLYEKEAFYALNYSKKFIHGHKSKITPYKECLLENFFDLCEENLDLRLLCRADIQRIWEYDKQNKTDFVETIYVYLSTGKSLVESAKQLFVHRNTVVHRINKLEEILGEDIFSSEDSTLQLLLSCKVISYLKKRENEK